RYGAAGPRRDGVVAVADLDRAVAAGRDRIVAIARRDRAAASRRDGVIAVADRDAAVVADGHVVGAIAGGHSAVVPGGQRIAAVAGRDGAAVAVGHGRVLISDDGDGAVIRHVNLRSGGAGERGWTRPEPDGRAYRRIEVVLDGQLIAAGRGNTDALLTAVLGCCQACMDAKKRRLPRLQRSGDDA